MAPPTKPTSVSRIALWPEPMANSVPEAHEPPSCMPTPNRNAPTNETPADRGEAGRHRHVLEGHLVGQDRREQDAGGGEHQHVRAQRLALAHRHQLPPRRGEPEPRVEQHEAEGQADHVEQAGHLAGAAEDHAAQHEGDAEADEHHARLGRRRGDRRRGEPVLPGASPGAAFGGGHDASFPTAFVLRCGEGAHRRDGAAGEPRDLGPVSGVAGLRGHVGRPGGGVEGQRGDVGVTATRPPGPEAGGGRGLAREDGREGLAVALRGVVADVEVERQRRRRRWSRRPAESAATGPARCRRSGSAAAAAAAESWRRATRRPTSSRSPRAARCARRVRRPVSTTRTPAASAVAVTTSSAPRLRGDVVATARRAR